MAEFENFGFYTIDADYLEYLNNKNSEVYYNASYRNAIKPFVGIIIDLSLIHISEPTRPLYIAYAVFGL